MVDGIEYEIDLSEPNATGLRNTLEEFLGAARRTGGRIKRGAARPTRPAANHEHTQAVRKWARENGYDLAERRHIPNHVIATYNDAKEEAEAKRARRKVVKSAAG